MSQFVPANYFPPSASIVRPTGNGSLLQWFNALPTANGRNLATGWHIQSSRCSEELTKALKAFDYNRVSILHRMSGEIEEYWQIEQCSLIVLCNGFDDVWTMRNSDDRAGIAYGWKGGKGTTKLKSRVIVAELAAIGYYEPLTTTMEGYITEEYLKALAEQFKVLDAFEHQFQITAPFYGFALEMAPAQKARMVGNTIDSDGKRKQSPIIPMVAVIPALDAEYFQAHLAQPDVLRYITENDLLRKTIQWSVDTSHRINSGEDREVWETEEYAATLGHTSVPRTPRQPVEPLQETMQSEAAAPSAEDSLPATSQQLASITKLYGTLNIGNSLAPDIATFGEAKDLLKSLSQQLREKRKSSK